MRDKATVTRTVHDTDAKERALLDAVAQRRARERTPRDRLIERAFVFAAIALTVVLAIGLVTLVMGLV